MEEQTKKVHDLTAETEEFKAQLSGIADSLEHSEDLTADREVLMKMLQLLPVGVWIMNREGRIIHGNPAGQQIWAGARYVGMAQFGEYKGWRADTGKLIAAEEWAASRAITKGEGSIREELEIECFDGTHKFILNSAMPIHDSNGAIIGAIVVNEDITEIKRAHDELKKLNSELTEALNKVKLLSGFLPICANCKKIRDDSGYWKQIEKYISEHSEAAFTHSICPECYDKLYSKELEEIKTGKKKGA